MISLPKPGDTLGGKYRIVRAIGLGGMGAVFEAENVLTRKRVAIKWIRAEHSEEAVARLVREAQASARIRHPNVVDVYDVERDGESVFLVMELLRGEPLSSYLESHTLEMHALIALLLPAMHGVAAAHRQGVVHRDIKPDNIFLARMEGATSAVPKVLDFGISKLEARDGEQLTLTQTGQTLGTPLYMSYEQLIAAPDIDGRTDVYAFGVILYEALTGRPPFEATTLSELIIKAAMDTPPAPKDLRAEVPTALSRLVLWAMARQREQRIASMEALISELEPFATPHGFRAQVTVRSESLAAHSPMRDDRGTAALPAGVLVDSARGTSAKRAGPVRSTAPSLKPDRAQRRGLLALGLSLPLLLLGSAVWYAFGREPTTRVSNVVPPLPPPASSPQAAPASSALHVPDTDGGNAGPGETSHALTLAPGGDAGEPPEPERPTIEPTPPRPPKPRVGKRTQPSVTTQHAAIEPPEPEPAPKQRPSSGPDPQSSETSSLSKHRVNHEPLRSEF